MPTFGNCAYCFEVERTKLDRDITSADVCWMDQQYTTRSYVSLARGEAATLGSAHGITAARLKKHANNM